MKTKAFILIAALCLAALAPQHSAAQWTGSGTSAADPYLITNVADLALLATNVNGGNDYSNKFFRLTANLNLDVPPYNSGEGWTPIGNNLSNTFKGVFDGDGKTISGLFINRISTDYQGLFGVIDGGEVKNLGLENVNIKGKDFVGSVAGEVTNSSLTNCYAIGDVSGIGNNVGGVAGKVFSDVLIGSGISRLTNCSATGNVSGIGNNVGGVAGEVVVNGVGVISLTNCYATGDVSGNNQVGGVAGVVTGSSLSNCYATGAVSGNNNVGGVAGDVLSSSLSNCAALNPSVTATGSNAGRVAGYVYGGALSGNIAWAGMTINGATVSGSATDVNGASKTADELMASAAFPTGFDSDPWTYAPTFLPGLNGSPVEMPPHILLAASASAVLDGNGTPGTPYLIKTPAQLAWLAAKVNAGTGYSGEHFKLNNPLDLSAYGSNFNSGKGWIPVGGTYPNQFKGNFDGDGKTISGLYINDNSNSNPIGLFGWIDNATLKNLMLANVDITGSMRVGGVAGVVVSSSLSNCHVTGTVFGNSNDVGGVAGAVTNSSLTDCHATCTVSGINAVGGVAGTADADNYSSITNCSATGAVSGNNYVGGVAGGVSVIDGGVCSLTNCYATGAVSGNNYVGGVAGQLLCLSGGVSLSNCYATGAVSGDNFVGGVAGVVLSSSLSNCAALNPSVTATGSDVGRVAGANNNGTLSGNIAWDGITVNGTTVTGGATDINGASITALAIHADGTLGNRFIGANGWTLENGKIPGFGAAVDMPAYLIPPGTPVSLSATAGNTQVQLSWTAASTNGGSAITKYEYAYGTSASPTNWTNAGNVSTVTVSSLSNGTTYYFAVRAVNAAGNEGAAANATAKPAAPVTSAAITVVEPATGVAPVTTAPTGATGYSCSTVTWTPNNNPFSNNTAYTASVTLTADAAYTFPTGFTAATINGQTATVTNNIGTEVTLSYTFLKTVSNTGASATRTYDGSTIDLSGISSLFTIDGNAGAKTYTIETGGTAAGSIAGDNKTLTVTACGTFTIGLTTEATATHLAGAKVTATLTVNRATPTADVSLTGWTYGDAANTPTVSSNPEGGTVTYKYCATENGTYTTTQPTDAGTYYIYAEIAETANYAAYTTAKITFTIAKKALTVSGATLAAKTYDGTTTGTVASITFSGLQNAEVLTDLTDYTVTATFDDANAGTTHSVDVEVTLLATTKANNYEFANAGDNEVELQNQSIDQKAITAVGITANNKVYDGNTAASVTVSSLTGKVGDDDVTLSGGAAHFDNANVGNGKTVTWTGYSLNGAKAGNYLLDGGAQTATATANITAVSATVVWTNTALTYNGTAQVPTASITGVDGSTINLVVTGEQTNVGSYTATAQAPNANYTLSDASKTSAFNIAKATQTAPAAPTLASKTATNITLNTIAGAEYSVNGGTTWQDGVTFGGLTPSTSYAFIARLKATATHAASPNSTTLSVTTDVLVITNAETPSITAQPQDVSYTLNEAARPLSVTAIVTDGGTLSYQWYRNSSNSNSGGTAIGTNSKNYTPLTDAIGTYSYYVVVTNSNNSVNGKKTATTKSAPAAVTVNVPSYAVVVSLGAMTNGTVSTDKTSAAAGETVTLTITPDANYTLNVISAYKTDASDTAVDLSGTGNTRTFTMPPYAITVEATFKAGTTGIDNPEAKAFKVYVKDGLMHVSGLTAGKLWAVYSMAGVPLHLNMATGDEADVSLPARGVYIVKSGNNTVKIVY